MFVFEFEIEFWLFKVARGGAGVFRRALRLPFAPSLDIRYHFPEDEDEDDGWEVRRVAWLAAEGRFVAQVEDDEPLGADWELLKEHYAALGWDLVSEVLDRDDG